MFYPEKKPHISPSALSSWQKSRQSFIKSYFAEERTPETYAMKAGTMIHGLIEAGLLEGHKHFSENEKVLIHPSPVEGVDVLGKPDSFGLEEGSIIGYFVDYKTGRDVSWSREDLANDLKMRTTAWLVWNELGKPKNITGYIVWLGTEWNGKEVIPSDSEYMIIKYVYTESELQHFGKVIEKTIEEVNEAYPRYLNPTDNIDEDLCKNYAEVYDQIKWVEDQQIAPLKEKLNEIKKVISDQMEFGLSESHKSEVGTFFWRSTKKYEFPEDLEFQIESGDNFTLALGEEVEKALKVAKKTFEAGNDPMSESKTLQFRAVKKK